MKQLDIVAAVLVAIGALNWGLVAIGRFDLVAALFWKRVQGRWSHAAALHAR